MLGYKTFYNNVALYTGGDTISGLNLIKTGLDLIDRVVGGLTMPSVSLLLADTSVPIEIVLYNLAENGVFLTKLKSKTVVEWELNKLGFSKVFVEEVGEFDSILSILETVSNSKVVIEYLFDPIYIAELKGITLKNNLAIFLFVPKNYYNDRKESLAKYLCDYVMLFESDRSGDKLIFKFAMPKALGSINLVSYMRFKVEKGYIEADTSREVA